MNYTISGNINNIELSELYCIWWHKENRVNWTILYLVASIKSH